MGPDGTATPPIKSVLGYRMNPFEMCEVCFFSPSFLSLLSLESMEMISKTH